jgi:hypothetical protein
MLNQNSFLSVATIQILVNDSTLFFLILFEVVTDAHVLFAAASALAFLANLLCLLLSFSSILVVSGFVVSTTSHLAAASALAFLASLLNLLFSFSSGVKLDII